MTGTSGHPRLTQPPPPRAEMSLGNILQALEEGGSAGFCPCGSRRVDSGTQWSLPSLGWSPGPTSCWLVHPRVSLSLSFFISKMELIQHRPH